MTEEEIDRIHESTLELLERTGVRLEHDEIVQRVLRAGARKGNGTQDVLLPREMVREQLSAVPRSVELADRAGGTTVLTCDSPPVFWTNPGMHVWDGATLRDASSSDLAEVARLSDGLDTIQGVMGMAMKDVSPQHRDFVGVRIIAENCRKHIRTLSFTPAGCEALAQMRNVFPGNWFSMGFTAHGPLRWTRLALDIFEKSAGHGIPVTINGEPMAGVTGPVTVAGSAVVGNAEILSGIVVNELLEPGRPVVYNLGLAHVFDMKTATAVTGGPENALLAQASAELGRFYGIPSASWVSTEALLEDEQAGLEKMFGFHTHIASGVNLIWGMGQLESEKTMSLAQLVIDDEMVRYVRRYILGFRGDEESIRPDVIRSVGIAGSFLDTDHTLTEFREHLYEPVILNRRIREDSAGALHDVARARARGIIASDTDEKIEPDRLAELLRIEEFYKNKIG